MLNHDRARKLLGVIRIVNGALALLAPKRLTKMLGADPESNGAALYALRLFGVRTVLLGIALLRKPDECLEATVREAPIIHTSDLVAVVIGGVTGELPVKGALIGGVTSALNTVLAFCARAGLSHDRS